MEVLQAEGHSMGEIAKRFEVSREDQDAFSIESHKRAVAAIESGKFVDEIVPITTAEGTVTVNAWMPWFELIA